MPARIVSDKFSVWPARRLQRFASGMPNVYTFPRRASDYWISRRKGRGNYFERRKEDMNAFNKQVGGNHYKDLPIQPTWFIRTNGFGFIVGNIIKYACRYAVLGNEKDLKKIMHYAEIEAKEKDATYEIRSKEKMLDTSEQSNSDGGSGSDGKLPVRDLRPKKAVERDASWASG